MSAIQKFENWLKGAGQNNKFTLKNVAIEQWISLVEGHLESDQQKWHSPIRN